MFTQTVKVVGRLLSGLPATTLNLAAAHPPVTGAASTRLLWGCNVKPFSAASTPPRTPDLTLRPLVSPHLTNHSAGFPLFGGGKGLLVQRCLEQTTRWCSSKEFVTPSPYKVKTEPYRFGYKYKAYKDGPLPRPKNCNIKISMPEYKPRDVWNRARALHGQNDYIDILGDGSLHPTDLLVGPAWLRRFRGSEMKRTLRRIKFEAHELAPNQPFLFRQLKLRVKRLTRTYRSRKKRGPAPRFMN